MRVIFNMMTLGVYKWKPVKIITIFKHHRAYIMSISNKIWIMMLKTTVRGVFLHISVDL